MSYGSHIQRIAGNIQIGDKTSWRLYNIMWNRTLKDLMDNNIDAGNDQRVIGTIALRYHNFINLVYPSIDYKGNRWWYLLLKFSEKTVNLINKPLFKILLLLAYILTILVYLLM
ncbi:MAG: hypothetical protein MTP17_04115 [Candidatus Midichloria sp.]|nr:MAG: hypothetical protein MTP17_04115 [Candidatus Midichloria sp.]